MWVPWIIIELDHENGLLEEEIVQNICFINNITDPIIYAFMSRYFRRVFFILISNISKLKFH